MSPAGYDAPFLIFLLALMLVMLGGLRSFFTVFHGHSCLFCGRRDGEHDPGCSWRGRR